VAPSPVPRRPSSRSVKWGQVAHERRSVRLANVLGQTLFTASPTACRACSHRCAARVAGVQGVYTNQRDKVAEENATRKVVQVPSLPPPCPTFPRKVNVLSVANLPAFRTGCYRRTGEKAQEGRK